MSLSYNEFRAVIVNRNAETVHALASHKSREADRDAIAKQIAEFEKRGKKIEVLPYGVKRDIDPKIKYALDVAESHLRATFGMNLQIIPSGDKFKALYHGNDLGLFDDIKLASKAIKKAGIKHKQDIKKKGK